jgi:tRNA-dihydrouridine synthase B
MLHLKSNPVKIQDYSDLSFSLKQKISYIKEKRPKVQLGPLSFDSPLLLAPMAAICHAPFRLLMQDLGAGGSVSELVSADGIIHGNARTQKMLWVDRREQKVGLQLFGEDPEKMSAAAKIAESYGADFIDINMGCPVKKVVTRGAGSALLKENPETLSHFFKTIKAGTTLPLTIKIRTGWDEQHLNAEEILSVAKESHVSMVAIHGRTRAQQYMGQANWTFLESLAAKKMIPLIGNGDLHTPEIVSARLAQTHCDALMLARGPLRFPFIFLETFIPSDEKNDLFFSGNDYLEIIHLYLSYLSLYHSEDLSHSLIQIKKHIVWFAHGMHQSAQFRQAIFTSKTLKEILTFSQQFFQGKRPPKKLNDPHEIFMTSGHG